MHQQLQAVIDVVPGGLEALAFLTQFSTGHDLDESLVALNSIHLVPEAQVRLVSVPGLLDFFAHELNGS